MHIRNPNLGDVPRIQKLAQALPYGNNDVIDYSLAKDQYFPRIRNSFSLIAEYEPKEDIIGYAISYSHNHLPQIFDQDSSANQDPILLWFEKNSTQDSIYLEQIGVKTPGTPLAHQLLHSIQQRSKEKKYSHIVCGIHNDNLRSQRFFKRAGFEKKDELLGIGIYLKKL
jgi:ribosomal protein S18 acetylase RimI-like enzyme